MCPFLLRMKLNTLQQVVCVVELPGILLFLALNLWLVPPLMAVRRLQPT
jgi:hypothetical protein